MSDDWFEEQETMAEVIDEAIAEEKKRQPDNEFAAWLDKNRSNLERDFCKDYHDVFESYARMIFEGITYDSIHGYTK